MSLSTELSSRDVVKALETLSDAKTKILVFHLGVETYILQNIESRYNAESHKIHAIQAWLDQDSEASWEKIVFGLIEIKMNVLAKQIATQHCSQLLDATMALRESTNIHTTQEFSTVPSPAAIPSVINSRLTATHTAPDGDRQWLSVISRGWYGRCHGNNCAQKGYGRHGLVNGIWPSNCGQFPSAIQRAKLQLEKRFVDLICDAQRQICEKEMHDRQFLDRFRNCLLLLPLPNKAIHINVFLDEILAAKDAKKLLAIICLHSDYRNHEILYHIITRFCGATLQKNMQKYCKQLEEFQMATTVDVYISAMPPEEQQQVAKGTLSEMAVKIGKPSSRCTLYEIQKLAEAITELSYLSFHGLYVGSVSPNRVVVVIRFPSSAMGWLLAVMTLEFMHTHLLTEVSVDKKCLTLLKADKNILVYRYNLLL